MLLYANLGTIADGSFYEDVADLSEWMTSNVPRVLVSMAVDGDDAAADCAVQVTVDGYQIAEIYNTGTDGIITVPDFISVYGFIPPKSQIKIKSSDTTAADAVYVAMEIVNV